MRGSGSSLSPTCPSVVSILFGNVRSTVNKRDALSSVIDTCNAHIIALTETWLSTNIRDSEIFHNASNFSLYRCDRTIRRGGGVMLAISKDLPSLCVHIKNTLEMVWASVTINHQKVVIGVCYRSPSSPPGFVNDLHDAINNIRNRFPLSPVFLLGDFNFPNIDWHAEQPHLTSFSQESSDFLEMCSIFSLTQLVSEPTRIADNCANTLDLILTNRPDFVSPITYLPGISDHCLLTLDIHAPILKTRRVRKTVHDYSRADFASINNALSQFIEVFFSKF